MEYTADTPRAQRTIAGRSCTVIQPFAEGQPLTPATAAMLNQTLAENFSNNLRDAINAGQIGEDGKPLGTPAKGKPGSDDYVAPSHPLTDEQVQALVDEYMAEYQPGVRTGGSGTPRVTDPVEREARAIARSKVVEKLKAQGLKTKDVDMGELVEGVFQKHRDALMAAGKKVVAALEAASKNTEGLDISLDSDEGTPAETPAAAAA